MQPIRGSDETRTQVLTLAPTLGQIVKQWTPWQATTGRAEIATGGADEAIMAL